MKIKNLLLTLIIVLFSSTLYAPIRTIDDREIENTYIRIQKENKYFELYRESLETLKDFEGLSLISYRDANGKSIGYGHHIQSYERIPNKITEEYAESLLRIDYEHAISTVEKYTGFNRYNEPEKVLALSHFVYNLGSGNFINSTMLYNIQNNKPIDKEIIRWVHIKSRYNSHLYSRRIYELNLYKNG